MYLVIIKLDVIQYNIIIMSRGSKKYTQKIDTNQILQY